MNWRRVLVFAGVLGAAGATLNLLGSLLGPSGLELSAGLILFLSAAVFVALGCLQRHRTWLHAVVVSLLAYAMGDALSRLLVPKLASPLEESLAELAVFIIIASLVARLGVWLRARIEKEARAS